MNHSPHPKSHDKDNEERQGWKDLSELLSQCWKGLSVQRNTASHEKIANGRSKHQTLQGNGYQWDPTANVLLIQSWDIVFGRPPPKEDKRYFENSDYLRYLEKMQQKLANILLHIISRNVTSAGRGRKKEDNHSSIHLPRINIQTAEPENQRNQKVLSDFNEFIRTFNLSEEDDNGDHIHSSPFDSISFKEEDRPDSSRNPHDHYEKYPHVEFKERARIKVSRWLSMDMKFTPQVQAILQALNFESFEIVPQNVLTELATQGLLPFDVIGRESYTWSDVIDGKNHPLFLERPLNTREISHRIKEWLSVHNISNETVAAILRAEINPDSKISPNVLKELQQHRALKKLFIRNKNMTWAELMDIIHTNSS